MPASAPAIRFSAPPRAASSYDDVTRTLEADGLRRFADSWATVMSSRPAAAA